MYTLGTRITSIRKLKGLSQEKLAEDAKINLRTLQRIETGRTTPHGDTLSRICEALDISIEEVMKNEKKEIPQFLKATAYIFLIIVVCVVVYSQFGWKSNKHSVLITKRIQYDVPIASHDLEFFWWVENLEVTDRITYVTNLFDKALSGKVKTCDIYMNPVTPKEIEALYNDTLVLTLAEAVPPYNLYDTVIFRFIEPSEVDFIRFQEEWTYNDENLLMEKHVLGICPVIREKIKGKQTERPLFWIYFDDALLIKDVPHSVK